MTGFMNNDGSELVGAQLPSGAGQALQLDSGGNLKTTATVTPAANQRVNAQSGDFVTGSIVDLLTLLTLAGTSGDANTVASFMGRFTKIRDLLSTFAYDNSNELKVSLYGKGAGAAGDTPLGMDASGRLTAAIQAVLGTALAADQSNTILKVSMYGTNATGGDTAFPINASGNIKTNINGVSAGVTFPTKMPTSATGTITSVAGAASDTALLASNTSRLGAYFFNDSTATLYLAFAGSVSTTAYTVQIPAGGFFEMPTSPVYTGAIHGIWSAANGNVRISEMS